MAVMRTVYFGLGSNLGDRKGSLATAVDALSAQFGTPSAKSAIYQTAAWGLTEQPDFFNQVVAFQTGKSASVILERILGVEKKMGRIRKTKWGPRTIDIDILFYGNLRITKPNLDIPHPRIADRRFVLIPLVEIAGQFIHPDYDKNLQELLDHCKDEQNVKLLTT